MELNIVLPPFIALCGTPGSGKSTAAKIICEAFGGCEIIDTGGPLRQIAMNYLGLTREQVYTQEGKASFVNINGQTWQVRKILGDLGKKLEDMFGEEMMPFMSHQIIQKAIKALPDLDVPTFVDPSCRKVQGHYWKRHGGLIIGINNPMAPPSSYEFDTFDESAVDIWIDNDGLAKGLPPEEALRDLEGKLVNAIIGHRIEGLTRNILAA